MILGWGGVPKMGKWRVWDHQAVRALPALSCCSQGLYMWKTIIMQLGN